MFGDMTIHGKKGGSYVQSKAFALLLIQAFFVSHTYGDCPRGWDDNGSGKCYLFPSSAYSGNNYMKQPACASFCSSVGGSTAGLPCVKNNAENEFIRARIPANAWIGYNDVAKEGTFRWQARCTSTYTKWDSGEPNNKDNEDYTMLKTTGMWQDVDSRTLYCVCEMPEPSVPPPACPGGSVLFADGDNTCYRFLPDPMTYSACGTACANRGLKRLCVQNEDQNYFIQRMGDGDTWMGLRRNVNGVVVQSGNQVATPKFVWYTGCSAPVSVFSDWAHSKWQDGQPDNANGNEDSAVTRVADGRWNDIPGSANAYCACETYSTTVSPSAKPTSAPTMSPSNPTPAPTFSVAPTAKPTFQPSPKPPVFVCPTSDPKYKASGDKCFNFNGVKDYNACKSYCDALGKTHGRLTTIALDGSSQENTFLLNNVPSGGNIWTAWKWARDPAGPYGYLLKWDVPCYTPEQPAYTNWNPGEPNYDGTVGNVNLCTQIYGRSDTRAGKWNDISCSSAASECVCETILEPGGLECSSNFRRRHLRGEAVNTTSDLA